MAMLTFLVCLLPIVASVYQPRIVEVPKIEDSDIYIVNITNNALMDVKFLDYSDPVLNLSGKNIQVLRTNAFNNVRDVESLDLSNNYLVRLRPYIFSNLTKLKRLSLAHNYIRRTVMVFAGLKSLQLLDISYNPLMHYFKGTLFGVPNSTRILLHVEEIYATFLVFYPEMYRERIFYPRKPSVQLNASQYNKNNTNTNTEIMNNTNTSERSKINDMQSKNEKINKTFDENAETKFCISNGTILLFDILGKEDILSKQFVEGCFKANLHKGDMWIVLLTMYSEIGAITGFRKFWYQPFSLPIFSLRFMSDRLNDIHAEMLNDLPASVTDINLDFNKISKIRSNVIKNYHIKTMSIAVNWIEEIEDNAFEETRLQQLSLNANRLEHLRFVLTLPNTLINLCLSRNRITSIHDNVFSVLPNMTNLDLQLNRIKMLSDNAFSGIPHLTELNLQNNQIETLPNNIFSGLPRLTVLSLNNNNIHTLQHNIFHNLTLLVQLSLGSNNITTIEPDLFKGLKVLASLNLGSNSIRDLHVNSFVDLKELKFLDLSGNKFIKVPSIHLPQTLNTLYLEHNEISALEKNSFVEVPRHDLHLNGNPISRIARGAFNLPTLTELYIEKTHLTTIDGDSFEGLNNLTLLHLSQNKISEIRKGSCKNLKNLTKMVLTSNPLQKLESGAFYGLKMNIDTTVYFEENNLREIQPGLFEDI